MEENDEVGTIDAPLDTKAVSMGMFDEEGDEVFPAQVSVQALDNSQYLTLLVNSREHVHFQIDTGAQCNVLPVAQYKRASGDDSLTHVLPDVV